MTNNNHETRANASNLLAALQAILPYALTETRFINRRNDGSWKDEKEAREANDAIAQAEAAIAEAKGLAA